MFLFSDLEASNRVYQRRELAFICLPHMGTNKGWSIDEITEWQGRRFSAPQKVTVRKKQGTIKECNIEDATGLLLRSPPPSAANQEEQGGKRKSHFKPYNL